MLASDDRGCFIFKTTIFTAFYYLLQYYPLFYATYVYNKSIIMYRQIITILLTVSST